jgi:FtsP/CotA-like multicopper oxidase with cupredoxin domain
MATTSPASTPPSVAPRHHSPCRDRSPLDPNEQGWKDTIRVGGGQLVRVAGPFGGGNGRYVYHCHILEHEDEGMMRTFVVMPEQVMKLDPHVSDGHHPLHPA